MSPSITIDAVDNVAIIGSGNVYELLPSNRPQDVRPRAAKRRPGFLRMIRRPDLTGVRLFGGGEMIKQKTPPRKVRFSSQRRVLLYNIPESESVQETTTYLTEEDASTTTDDGDDDDVQITIEDDDDSLWSHCETASNSVLDESEMGSFYSNYDDDDGLVSRDDDAFESLSGNHLHHSFYACGVAGVGDESTVGTGTLMNRLFTDPSTIMTLCTIEESSCNPCERKNDSIIAKPNHPHSMELENRRVLQSQREPGNRLNLDHSWQADNEIHLQKQAQKSKRAQSLEEILHTRQPWRSQKVISSTTGGTFAAAAATAATRQQHSPRVALVWSRRKGMPPDALPPL